jgi:hypothetical protein
MLLGVFNGQTMYDLVQRASAPLEDTVVIAFANGLAFDSEEPPIGGTQFYVNNDYINTQPTNIVFATSTKPSTTATLYAVNNQSIYDICLMTYGNLESVTLLKRENLDVAPVPNDKFVYDTTKISNYQFYYNVKNKFGYLCSIDGLATPSITSYLLTEASNYIITENSMYIEI